MRIDTKIPNGFEEFFLRMVAETPALDDLRILYVFVSFSSSSSMNSQISSKTARGKETSMKISQVTAR